MLINQIVHTSRNLWKNKTYSLINIAGLAVSLATCILLLLWVRDELSYDRFHKNAANIYRTTTHFVIAGKENLWSTPAALATFAKPAIPEIQNACRLGYYSNISLIEYRDKKIIQTDCGLADSSFFTMFSFPLIKGNPHQPFTDNRSVVLTETLSGNIFGNEDPIGKTIMANDKKVYHV